MHTNFPSRSAALAVAILALATSRPATPTSDDGPLSEARRVWHGEVRQAVAAGFAPALCTGEMAAPELLALADWPLDADRRTCRTQGVAGGAPRAGGRIEDVVGHPPVARVEVVDDERPLDTLPGGAAPLTLAAAVGEDELAGLRGGFELPGGLVMSFGLERLVYINGVLTSSIRLNVVELGELLASGVARGEAPQSTQATQATQATQTTEATQATQATQVTATPVGIGSTLAVIQNGPGNTVATEVLTSGALGTVIQNSLNNQRMQIITTVNARVNSMELLRADRLGESIRNAIHLR